MSEKGEASEVDAGVLEIRTKQATGEETLSSLLEKASPLVSSWMEMQERVAGAAIQSSERIARIETEDRKGVRQTLQFVAAGVFILTIALVWKGEATVARDLVNLLVVGVTAWLGGHGHAEGRARKSGGKSAPQV